MQADGYFPIPKFLNILKTSFAAVVVVFSPFPCFILMGSFRLKSHEEHYLKLYLSTIRSLFCLDAHRLP